MNHFRISFASTVGYASFHLLQGLQKSGNLSWKLSIVINWTTWELMVIIWKPLFLKTIATYPKMNRYSPYKELLLFQKESTLSLKKESLI